MKTFFKLIAFLVVLGAVLCVVLSNEVQPEVRATVMFGVFGLFVLAKLGVFKSQKNS